MTIWICGADGRANADLLRGMNAREPGVFPPLTDEHLSDGHWWIASLDGEAVGFAGLVAMIPFPKVGYMKRAYVDPDYRGRGIQMEFMRRRQQKAIRLGYTTLVSECAADNLPSRRNFERAGFAECNPEQPWGAPGSIYFIKRLA